MFCANLAPARQGKNNPRPTPPPPPPPDRRRDGAGVGCLENYGKTRLVEQTTADGQPPLSPGCIFDKPKP